MKTLFNEYGHFLGEIPSDCVQSCSHQGECFFDVEHWQRKINFDVPRDKAIVYLRSTGGWAQDELDSMTDTQLAQKVLWIACCDIKESGEWFGLTN